MGNKFKTFIAIAVLSTTIMSFQQGFPLQESIASGKKIYQANCMSCHMAEGEGLPGVFPPLAKADMLGDDARMIKAILKGVSGPTVVNGVSYNGAMPAYNFTDQQTADILNYIRHSWGNQGKTILPKEVEKVRNAK